MTNVPPGLIDSMSRFFTPTGSRHRTTVNYSETSLRLSKQVSQESLVKKDTPSSSKARKSMSSSNLRKSVNGAEDTEKPKKTSKKAADKSVNENENGGDQSEEDEDVDEMEKSRVSIGEGLALTQNEELLVNTGSSSNLNNSDKENQQHSCKSTAKTTPNENVDEFESNVLKKQTKSRKSNSNEQLNDKLMIKVTFKLS